MKSQNQILGFYAAFFISSFLLIAGCTETRTEKTGSADTISSGKPALNLTCTGYIRLIHESEGRNTVVIDTIQLFSGDAAKKADGSEDGCYIRNSAADSLAAEITEHSRITMQTFSHDSSGSFRFNEKLSPGSFLELFRSKRASRFVNVPFTFVIQDGKILSVKEIYIP